MKTDNCEMKGGVFQKFYFIKNEFETFHENGEIKYSKNYLGTERRYREDGSLKWEKSQGVKTKYPKPCKKLNDEELIKLHNDFKKDFKKLIKKYNFKVNEYDQYNGMDEYAGSQYYMYQLDIEGNEINSVIGTIESMLRDHMEK